MENTEKNLINEDTEREYHEHHEHHEHREHHGHHHSHHHHTSGKKKKKKESRTAQKIRYYLRKNKKKLILNTSVILGSLAVLITVLVVIAQMDKKPGTQEEAPREDLSVAALTATVRLEVPFYTTPQYVASEAVKAYMNTDAQQSVEETVNQYWSANNRLDTGLPVKLFYEVSGIPEGCTVQSAVFEVSETEDFLNARTLTPAKGASSVSVYHLKTGTRYYYRVTLDISNGNQVMAQSSFETAQSPRMLLVDGAVNVRDIGGWTTASGQRIRQGLLYRGSELDGRVEAKYSITSTGMDTLLDVLQIRSEMDLRGRGYAGSLGEQVTYFNYAIVEYDSLLNSDHNEVVRQLFTELAKAENYPMYLHCTYGMDRTGTVCFLLEALLGVGEDDLIRDYALSAMHYGGVNEERFDDLLVALKRQAGSNLMEKTENYLISAGVTREQISSIRSIFLEQ